ncbi:MAG: GNAT family N-acetyltransferase [Deltaproteobacteria bacterium]|nr:GNAT family N-acetyltransferase [Deltaproteobacteria bacterium]
MKSNSQDVVNLVNFYKRQGHNILETESAYWCELHPFCYQNIPFHVAVNPAPEELNRLFAKKLVVLLRYNSVEDTDTVVGFNWICTDRDYGLHSLERKIRNRVKRGLTLTEVRPIDFRYLAREGPTIINEIARRQGRNPDFPNRRSWENYCLSAAATPNFDAYGAFLGGRLIAFLVGVRINECYFSLTQASHTEYLSYCPNNALMYTVVTEKFQDPGIEVFSYGLASVENLESLDRFKIGMNFKQEKINFKVVFNPYLGWLKNHNVVASVHRISNRFPKNNFIRKADALLRQINQDKAEAG